VTRQRIQARFGRHAIDRANDAEDVKQRQSQPMTEATVCHGGSGDWPVPFFPDRAGELKAATESDQKPLTIGSMNATSRRFPARKRRLKGNQQQE